MAKKKSARRTKKTSTKKGATKTHTAAARGAKTRRKPASASAAVRMPKARQTITLGPGVMVMQTARGEFRVGTAAELMTSKLRVPPTPGHACPSVDCQLAFNVLDDGLWVGVKGTCAPPCECCLFTLTGTPPRWKKNGPGTWVKFSLIQGAAAVCDRV